MFSLQFLLCDLSSRGDRKNSRWSTALVSIKHCASRTLFFFFYFLHILKPATPLLSLSFFRVPRAKRCALKACGNLGDCDEAKELLARMAEEGLKPGSIHWNHALRASAADGRWEEARERLKEMKVRVLLRRRSRWWTLQYSTTAIKKR